MLATTEMAETTEIEELGIPLSILPFSHIRTTFVSLSKRGSTLEGKYLSLSFKPFRREAIIIIML